MKDISGLDWSNKGCILWQTPLPSYENSKCFRGGLEVLLERKTEFKVKQKKEFDIWMQEPLWLILSTMTIQALQISLAFWVLFILLWTLSLRPWHVPSWSSSHLECSSFYETVTGKVYENYCVNPQYQHLYKTPHGRQGAQSALSIPFCILEALRPNSQGV